MGIMLMLFYHHMYRNASIRHIILSYTLIASYNPTVENTNVLAISIKLKYILEFEFKLVLL